MKKNKIVRAKKPEERSEDSKQSSETIAASKRKLWVQNRDQLQIDWGSTRSERKHQWRANRRTKKEEWKDKRAKRKKEWESKNKQ